MSQASMIDDLLIRRASGPRRNTYLTFTAQEPGTRVWVERIGKNPSLAQPEWEYRTRSQGWTFCGPAVDVTLVSVGDWFQIRSRRVEDSLNINQENRYLFHADKTVKVSGNMMSLLDRDMRLDTVPYYAFVYLFTKFPMSTAPMCTASTIGNLGMAHCFEYIKTLTSLPELFATSFGQQALYFCFNNCSAARHIRVHFTRWISNSSTNSWLTGVAPEGVFECPQELPEERGSNYIPEGWTIKRF